jgi:amidase
VITRSVRDSAALLDVSAGADLSAPYWAPPNDRPFLAALEDKPRKLRIAFSTRPWLPARVHPDCTAAVEDAASLCKELGHDVGDEHFSVEPRAFARHLVTVISAETAADIARWEALRGRPAKHTDFEVGTWLTVLLARAQSARDLCVAVKELQAISRRLATFFEDWDVILTPTLAQPPPLVGELKPRGAEAAVQSLIARLGLSALLEQPRVLDSLLDKIYNFLPFTPLANIAGIPSMSVPLFWNSTGLPIGACFTARFGDEATLLRLAAELESARPWSKRLPPLLR